MLLGTVIDAERAQNTAEANEAPAPAQIRKVCMVSSPAWERSRYSFEPLLPRGVVARLGMVTKIVRHNIDRLLQRHLRWRARPPLCVEYIRHGSNIARAIGDVLNIC